MKEIKIVISGSFRKNFKGIVEAVEEFNKIGVKVLSPKASKVINPGEDFAILESDETTDPFTLEQKHLDAITEADALYLFDPDGYIGDSSKMELGWAIALGKPVFCKEIVDDSTLSLYCGKKASPIEIKEILENRDLIESINNLTPLQGYQNYMEKVVKERGFDNETIKDIFLLMTEEIGELAKALRKYSGIKIDEERKDKYKSVEEEIADVFIYLIDLSNSLGISLSKAFREKEIENNKRTWK